jgi:hypothetical protein
MPKMSKETASRSADHGPVVEHADDLADYTVQFVTFRHDFDHSALLKGLPDDACQCPHWGYVFKGRVTFRFGDREEVYEAGDAFYAPPGHVPVVNEPGTEYLQFSPAVELAKTTAVLMENQQALQAS